MSHREHSESKKSGFMNQKLVRRLSFSPNKSPKSSDSDGDKKRRPAPKGGRRLIRNSTSQVVSEKKDIKEQKSSLSPLSPRKSPLVEQKPAEPVAIPPMTKTVSQPAVSSPRRASPTTSSGSPNSKDGKFLWKPIQGFATAIHPFEPQGKYQVRLQLGDKIKLQEQNNMWFKGIVLSTRKKGIFPQSFVHVTKKLYENEDDAMKELQVALWEWVGLLKAYYQVCIIIFFIQKQNEHTSLFFY